MKRERKHREFLKGPERINHRRAGVAFAYVGYWLEVVDNGRLWNLWCAKKPKLIQWWPESGLCVEARDWTRRMNFNRWQDIYRWLTT